MSLADVVDLLLVTHAPDRVASYRREMERGGAFPPIGVLRIGRRWIVVDGHKRLAAARPMIERSGGERLHVDVWTWRRFLLDQWRQADRHARLNARMVTRVFVAPGESWVILRSTLLHWRRVALSLSVALRRCLREEAAPNDGGPANG